MRDEIEQTALDAALPVFRDKHALIMFGDKDPMTGQKCPERWAKEIPQNQVRILQGVKHFTFEDDREATVEEFRAWWARNKVANSETVSSRNREV